MSAGGEAGIAQRLAGAPISWGVCEAPGWGAQLECEVVLGQMRGLGLRATELGPDGYLPGEPEQLRELLAASDLQLVGGFVPAVLHDATVRAAELASIERQARHIALAGGDVLVLAVVQSHDGYEEHCELDAAGWASVLMGLEEVQQVADETGLVLALHPHAGTVVERADDVRRVLDGSSVGVCLDTGHLLIGGVDPVELVEEAGERVVHVHLKDVDLGLAAQVREGGLGYLDAVSQGLYTDLGAGGVRLEQLLAALADIEYGGWYVLERDVRLADGDDGAQVRAATRRSIEYLQATAAAVGGMA